MKLTPLDIHHKEFHRSIRGYNEEEVDVFLDEVADEFERLFKENAGLQEQLDELKQKMKNYETIEQTLQNTLFTAQKTAEELQNNAKKEAELILRDAELKAKDMIQQALAEKQRIQQVFLRIKQAEEEFRMRFKSLLDDYGKLIKEIPVPEDILLLTAPSEDGEDVAAVAAALVLDRPAAAEKLAAEGEREAGEAAEAQAPAAEEAAEGLHEEAAGEVAEVAATEEAAEEEAATDEATPEAAEAAGAAEAAEAAAVAEPAQASEEPAEEAAAVGGPATVAGTSQDTSQDTAEMSAAELAAAQAGDEGGHGQGGASEPLLSSDVATVSSADGHVRGLTLGEVSAGEGAEEVDLPDFLKDTVDRTDEERERLRRRDEHAAGFLGEREEDTDIEEIS